MMLPFFFFFRFNDISRWHAGFTTDFSPNQPVIKGLKSQYGVGEFGMLSLTAS